MDFGVSDELVGTVAPIVVYWLYSGIYILLGSLENYRLHSKKDEDDKNLVSKGTVVKGVLLQQAVQAVVAIILFTVTGSDVDDSSGEHSLISLARQFFTAMVVLDTWQYFMHRYMHHNKFLYRHIHSQHHRLVVPYAFGALYNHPLEGLLLDTIGGALSFLISGVVLTCSFVHQRSGVERKTILYRWQQRCSLSARPYTRRFANAGYKKSAL